MFNKIRALLRLKQFKLYHRPYELNIVGLRSKSVIPNRFDDEIHVFYRTSAFKWAYHLYKATTDPGTYWLENPMQPQGTAILAEGQYINSHVLGLHKGEYLALVQNKPLTIMREYDRKAILDFYNGKKVTGIFGIDIHRANRVGTTLTVDRNSAGCQVFANADEFAQFLTLCEKHKTLYGNQFTYSLVDFRTVQRRRLRLTLYLMATLMGLGLAADLYFENKHSKTPSYV